MTIWVPELRDDGPKYQAIAGQTCYATLRQLPRVPDLVIYAISGLALEASFAQAMSLRVGGVVIYAANYLEDDGDPQALLAYLVEKQLTVRRFDLREPSLHEIFVKHARHVDGAAAPEVTA